MERNEILSAAEKAVTGQRTQDYGCVENSFSDIAALWSVYKNVDFTSHDAAVMMALMKIARIKSGHDIEDSYIDLCGYGAIAGELANAKKAIKTDLSSQPSHVGPHTAAYWSEKGGIPIEERELSDIRACGGCEFYDAKNMLCKNFMSRITNGICECCFSGLGEECK